MSQAKRQLEHGEWGKMVVEDLPFGERTAQRLMVIAQHPALTKATHVSLLPPSWGTLYELTKLPLPVLEEALAGGKVSPEMERGDVRGLFSKGARGPGVVGD